jgi:hypothetical protein
MTMPSYLAKIPPALRFILALPVLAIAYPVVMILIPSVIHAAVPEVVRSVLSLL